MQKWKKGSNKPSKLMISFLGVPSSNSFLFESSSFRATARPTPLFHRSLWIPGSLELLYSHVINPGSHPVMDMQNTSHREGFPKDTKLASRADG